MNGKDQFKKPFWKNPWAWGIPFLIVGAISLRTNEERDTSTTNTAIESSEKTVIKAQYVFDVPALVGKDLDDVIAALGTPKGVEPTAQQLELGVREWDKTFVKDGQELLVTYTISDQKVVDFFIGTDDPSGATRDKKHLLEIGNLSENDSRYTIEFVRAIKDSTLFTGVKIVPKNS